MAPRTKTPPRARKRQLIEEASQRATRERHSGPYDAEGFSLPAPTIPTPFRSVIHPSHGRIQRLGARDGPIYALAAELAAAHGHTDGGPYSLANSLYCRGLSAVVVAAPEIADEDIVVCARALMNVFMQEEMDRINAGRVRRTIAPRPLQSETDRILKSIGSGPQARRSQAGRAGRDCSGATVGERGERVNEPTAIPAISENNREG